MMRALGAEVVVVDQAPGSPPKQVSGEDLALVEERTHLAPAAYVGGHELPNSAARRLLAQGSQERALDQGPRWAAKVGRFSERAATPSQTHGPADVLNAHCVIPRFATENAEQERGRIDDDGTHAEPRTTLSSFLGAFASSRLCVRILFQSASCFRIPSRVERNKSLTAQRGKTVPLADRDLSC